MVSHTDKETGLTIRIFTAALPTDNILANEA